MNPQPRPRAAWVLDAPNLLHRYHHAMPVQLNKRGQQVHAVRGLADLVQRIQHQHTPLRIAAVFDAGDSGRSQLLPTYKSGRPPASTELVTQLVMAHDHLPDRRPGLHTLFVDGYEADDVIAELTRGARANGECVYIVSGDKDLLALVDDAPTGPEVAVYNRVVGKASEGWRCYHSSDVVARYGVSPSQLLDLLALTGDDADNVPGVPGVGPKTAAELLKQYNDLASLLTLISTVRRPALREALRACAEQIRLARRIVDFVRVPHELIINSLHRKNRSP